ncbi:AMP-binding protein [Pararobbsia alpina]|uniref:Long-chain-fatty-acid--CoA ligase n=1 Tax=Pararobbsia alpina TaxID=621374 RepID=A0A6S7CF48_9BURK|nr:AMP-binding protein [Pararobbsia alpina]CAB3778819.1 Long-chain-fatty-acid--CoA ligase [Pararobbsia alpina]
MSEAIESVEALIAPRDGLAYVRGSTDEPLSDATVGGLLRDTARRFAERPAVVFREQSIRWTWREFDAAVDTLALGLRALGLEKGDRVGIWSPNRVEWLVTQFATARLGAILVNINPAYRLTELEYALNKVGCRALITAERFKVSDYLQMLQTLVPELGTATGTTLRSARLPYLEHVIQMGEHEVSGMRRYREIVALGARAMQANSPAEGRDEGPLGRGGNRPVGSVIEGSGDKRSAKPPADVSTEEPRHALVQLAAIEAGLDCFEPVNVQFTSGTTGSPKGATLTHRNIVNNGRFIAKAMRLSEVDSLCIPVPFYHCFGMVLGVLACVSVGAQMVFPGEAFDPAATLQAVSDEECTALHGVPTMFIAELALVDFARFDLHTLRTGIMAGSPCPIETMKSVVARMHMGEVTIAYGMTETSPVSFQSSTADPLDKRVTTVGRIQPHLEVKIVDAAGQIVPVGETGELWTRGYSVMLGYWGDEEKTRTTLVDGWMQTGDLATLDEQGYCKIVGRLKDMVIRGGENVYPREIEEFLFRHPDIESVQVFGVPDEKYGEEICAWIVAKAGHAITVEDIRDFCRGQIAHFKVPRYVRFVDSIPMTVTGKAQKFVMREQMIRELESAKPKSE